MQLEFDNLNRVGLKYFTKGEYKLSLRYFLDAFRLMPYAEAVLYNVARAMDEMGNPMAEDFYVAAVGQGSVDAMYQLGVFYDILGRGEEAVEPLRAFLKAYQGHDSFTEDANSRLDKYDTHRMKLVWSRP
jgi:tetratricopeptide (TPR) repeat protein